MRRLLFEPDRAALAIEFDDAVALRVPDLIPEHGRAVCLGRRALERLGEPGAVEDVVAERQRHGVVADELAPDDERLRQAIGARLHGVA